MATKLGAAIGKLLRGVGRGRRDAPVRPPSTPSTPNLRPRPDGSGHSSGAPSADSSLAGAVIEYNPSLDGDADPGEVVWTWVPFEEDPTQGKDRPVVIVGRRRNVLIGLPLTSKRHDNELQVAVGTGSWDREGRTSYAKLERILEIDPEQVRREGAILSRQYFDRVIAALREL